MSEPIGEVTLARIRPHAVRVVLPCLVVIGGAGAIGFSLRQLREPGPWLWWGIAGALAVVLLGAAPILLWLRRRYTITNYRTRAGAWQTGSGVSEMPHEVVLSVTLRRNWWQFLFGSGSVVLLSMDGTKLTLVDVPNAVTVAQALRELTGNPQG